MPAPWTFEWEYAIPTVLDANRFKVGIINVRTGVSVEDYEQAGKLFAAAPDLLEALERAMPWLNKAHAENIHANYVLPKDLTMCIQQGRAAIAKAMGLADYVSL
jgi:hypothetical protein